MMRQIVLDTETTGLAAREGHRIIEVGAIEIVGRRITEKRLHYYVNPERDSDEGALAVHGLTTEFLADKPKFAEIADELLAFVRDAEVIIHNASFDLEFLDEELKRLARRPFAEYCARVTDSLTLARELHPGKRNSLDALCERYGVSNAHRKLHGALLDAELLAEVYIELIGGRQAALVLGEEAQAPTLAVARRTVEFGSRPVPRQFAIGADALAAHRAFVESIGENAIWKEYLTEAVS